MHALSGPKHAVTGSKNSRQQSCFDKAINLFVVNKPVLNLPCQRHSQLEASLRDISQSPSFNTKLLRVSLEAVWCSTCVYGLGKRTHKQERLPTTDVKTLS